MAGRMNLLAIETSTPYCSVAVCRGATVHARHFEAGQKHAELALDAVDALLKEAGVGVEHLDGLAFGAGPGSFTGLRIACGLVQGLALARTLPVVGISTLEALADEIAAERIVACLDARMGEVYHAAYERPGGSLNEIIAPGVYRPEAVPSIPGTGWVGGGSGFATHGAQLCARYGESLVSTHPGAAPTAAAVLRLALPRFERGETGDASRAVPIYLRDKVALKTSERR
jgi:tRNA threonylcarbamoyladenosine biosynthesis protein TsaB